MIIINYKKLRELMIRNGFTCIGLARSANISQSYFSQIINGKQHISAPIAIRISNALKCEFEDIYEINLDEYSKN